jgi:hypothetical protein
MNNLNQNRSTVRSGKPNKVALFDRTADSLYPVQDFGPLLSSQKAHSLLATSLLLTSPLLHVIILIGWWRLAQHHRVKTRATRAVTKRRTIASLAAAKTRPRPEARPRAKGRTGAKGGARTRTK